MGLQLEDGKGQGARAEVNADNQLLTRAITETDIKHASLISGLAFSWASGTYDPDAGDTILLVKNTHTNKFLHISRIWISTDVETRVQIHIPTIEVTVSGTTIVGVNLNTGSSNVAEASAARDETGNTQGDVIWSGEVQATSDPYLVYLNGMVILARNISIAVDLVSAATAADVTIFGHYE